MTDTKYTGDDSSVFLLSWDQEGLESCINATDIEKENVWAALTDTKLKNQLGPIVTMVMMRAQANPQRHYEVYTIHVSAGISEYDIREMFTSDPQGAADLIRSRGTKLASYREDKSRIKIT